MRPRPSGKLPPDRDSAPSGAPSCGLGAARAFRTDAASRPEMRRRRPNRVRPMPTDRPANSPSRRADASRSIPSGSPHTARNCCSNWLVTQASTVRCPELCGRGASSLISSDSSRVTKNSTHSTPTTSSFSRTQRASSTASSSHPPRHARRRDGHVQDVPAVLILDRAVVHELAVCAARRHHRNLAIEIDEGFEHGLLLADRVPGFGRAVGRVDPELTLAVVAEGGGLEHRRAAEVGQRAIQAHRANAPRDRASSAIRHWSGTTSRECAAAWCAEWTRWDARARNGQRPRRSAPEHFRTRTLRRSRRARIRKPRPGRRKEPSLPRPPLVRSACPHPARTCGRDSPCAAPRWRTCAPIARFPARRWWRRAKCIGNAGLDHASSSERTLAACSSRNTRSFSRSAGS